MNSPEEYFQRFDEPLAQQQIVMEHPEPVKLAELKDIVQSLQDRPYGDMEVLVLDEVGQRTDVFRDLATQLKKQHDVDTVVVKSPDLAVVVSDELTRAQIESIQPPMSNEADSAVALRAMPALLDVDPVPGTTMVGITGLLIILTVAVTTRFAKRSRN
ncbi:Rv1476 family membrane protein [Corynebacterium gerontici]|uniref:Uncharacterized protein n=1 Tax=Corynebacterium gerontici TaxID=2079234 RepID=A0A3G6J0Z0_9CORY|nr:DUF6676 family protein [Corynebacterium gerontici]AZA11453.1 hypothetical protein CGERO_05730 [Corynebacterium gerontici]